MGRGRGKVLSIALIGLMVLSAFGGLTTLAGYSGTPSLEISESSYDPLDIRTVLWKEDFEGYTPGQPIGPGVEAAVPPPGWPSGTIYPGLNTGNACAHFITDGMYWGDDINGGLATAAFAGGWVRMANVARFDLLLYDLGAGSTMVEVVLQTDFHVYTFDGGVYTQIPGITWALDTWYELWVEYNEFSLTYSVWWDGVEYAQDSDMMPLGSEVTDMVWFGDTGVGAYIDNNYHWTLDLSPVADAGPDQYHPPSSLVTFDGSGSYDDKGITTYTWEFFDGTPVTLTGISPSYFFTNPGVYNVTLTVTDSAGQTDTDLMTVTIVSIYDKNVGIAAQSNDWILMSFPNKISGHPFSVIVDYYGDTDWDMICCWDDLQKKWIRSAKFWPPSLNEFNYVDNTMGFYLHISTYGDGILSIEGPLATTGESAMITMITGWNLVGYPLPSGQPASGTIGTLGGLMEPVYTYDPMDPYHNREFNVWGEFQLPGEAYWIYVTFDEPWIIWCP